ncbi:MAG: tetraacyldisaccharide 4'-kinase [Gammaproteobacteria bacterium]
MKKTIHQWINRYWYACASPGALARCVHAWMARLIRARRQRWIVREKVAFSVPIVVVGNLTVGGTGKTPLLMALAHWMGEAGLRVGVVSRGYGAHAPYYPYFVSSDTPVACGGDEPCMLAERLNIPVVIDGDRPRAVAALLKKWPKVNIILSDDGLQHYALDRAVEMVVVDGQRRLGNGLCLPLGPLREPIDRLSSVSLIVVNGGDVLSTSESRGLSLPPQISMNIEPEGLLRLKDQRLLPIGTLADLLVGEGVAVAGIGNPERFFHTLRQLGLTFKPRVFTDHHTYTEKEIASLRRASWVLMTEKDAVKLRSAVMENGYVLRVNATVSVADWLQVAMVLRSQLQPWSDISNLLAHNLERLRLRLGVHSKN